MDIKKYWEDVLSKNAVMIKKYFYDNAYINWHNSNEQFTVDEFIRANCEYPGYWEGEVKRTEEFENLIVTVTFVKMKNKDVSFYAVSFFRIFEDKILSLDEYWGDNGPPPLWRTEKNIGKKIKQNL